MLRVLFCSRPSGGELAGRYVLTALVGCKTEQSALKALPRIAAMMAAAYQKMKSRHQSD